MIIELHIPSSEHIFVVLTLAAAAWTTWQEFRHIIENGTHKATKEKIKIKTDIDELKHAVHQISPHYKK